MKIAIIGADGQLGRDIEEKLLRPRSHILDTE